jgi:hypothetical protein
MNIESGKRSGDPGAGILIEIPDRSAVFTTLIPIPSDENQARVG